MSDITTDFLDKEGQALGAERRPVLEIVNDSAKTGMLATPEDFTSPDEIYQVLVEKIKLYHPSDDFSMIEKAYHIADDAHKDQRRKSGEPYIIHPLCVAIILAGLEMDKETIAAGLLHDVIEDTEYTKEDLAREFSPEIALLVDGVTKLTQLNLSQDKIEIQAENLRKMFLAMAKDIRVIIIKLADRLHNLRTLQYQTAAKQVEKARETMDIYAPIANRLGISRIQVEMDDLCMQYLYPEIYKELRESIDEKLNEREDFINDIVNEVTLYMNEAEIDAEIEGRVKHIFSIYKKMKTQGKTLDQIYDVFALRIKVASVRDCYAALGIIHEKYKPIPGRFKDYIAMPKANMYQSLHTTLIGHGGIPFEIQIRTYDMHRTAEYGIAAHWKYKEGGSKSVSGEEEKLNWLQEILDWQNDTKDNKEFMNAVKTDLDMFQDQVYCFTPAGDVKPLPRGSNTIDFAYAIHTAVGNRMVGARINGRQVPIETQLHSGDRVEIITSHPVEDVNALKKEFDAVVVAVGHSKGKVLPIFAGKRFVKTAVDFLHEAKKRKGNIKVPENVLVIGGGDVAMDTVTTLKLLGVKQVTDVVYETFEEFKASKKELEGAQEQGVSIIDGYVPVALKGKKVVFQHRYIPAKLEVKADLIILAVGQYTEAGLLGFEVNKLQEVTNAKDGVFTCGDISMGNEKTVVYAVRNAKEVAYQVKKYLGGK